MPVSLMYMCTVSETMNKQTASELWFKPGGFRRHKHSCIGYRKQLNAYHAYYEQLGDVGEQMQESACEMIWNLMEIEPCQNEKKAEICYKDTFRGQEFSAIITVDGKGKMKKDGETFDFLRL